MSTVAAVLGYIWSFINGIQVPILGISFGSLFLSIIVIELSISILKMVLGLGAGGFRNFGQKHDQDVKRAEKSNSKYRKP